MSKYARGHAAWGICGRSARKMLLKDMVFDGRYPNMRVDPAWFEPKDPLDYAPRVDDPVALWRPAPDNWRLTAPMFSLDAQSSTTATLSWTASVSDACQTTQYQLFYRPVDSEINWIAGPVFPIVRDMFGAITSETLNTVFALPVTDGIYEFLMVSTDSCGLSASSNEVQMQAGDPYFNNVVLLLHADSDGGLFKKDHSIYNHTLLDGPNQPQVSVPKFGNSSFGTDESAEQFWRIADSPAWDLASGDWTVECFHRITTPHTFPFENYIFWWNGVSPTYPFRISCQHTGFSANAPYNYIAEGTNAAGSALYSLPLFPGLGADLSPGVYRHIALVRHEDEITLYVEGAVYAGPFVYAGLLGNPVGEMQICGGNGFRGGADTDEIRITKGVARYTGPFTPPTSPFKNF